MRKWKKITSSLGLMVLCFLVSAQDIPLGTWRTHFSYFQARHLALAENKLFCATDNGLFYLDREENSVSLVNKILGLSDAGISAIQYSELTETLVIGYSSGSIDLVSDKGVHTLPAFKESSLSGAKTISDIQFWRDRALLATTFGVIVVDIPKKEIVENYRSIGANGEDLGVEEMIVSGDQLLVVTSEGVQAGSLNTNLLDFNNWTRYGDMPAGHYGNFGLLGDTVFLIRDDTAVVRLAGESWEATPWTFRLPVKESLSTSEAIYWVTKAGIYALDGKALIRHIPLADLTPNDLIYADGFWLADQEKGLYNVTSGESIVPAGPLNDEITRLRFIENRLYALHGPQPDTYSGSFDSLGYSYFDNYSWQSDTIPGFYNLTDVALFHDELYFSSAGHGLYNATAQQVLNETNTPLTNSKDGSGLNISGLLRAGDRLWATAYNNTNPLWSVDENRTWTAYTENQLGSSLPTAITASGQGVLWVTRGSQEEGGLYAFAPETDELRLINTGDDLPSNTVNGVAIDLNGEAWVATTNGIVNFPEATFIFDEFNAILPVFENALLFENENVSAVETDGGNRIWMSTKSGLWVFNSAITRLDHYFNEENSPLPSNNVLQMEYNPVNGEMFILTDKGLASFRSSSSRGTVHRNVSIFPNPVRPGFSGLVGIKGVANNAAVKITDIHGKLVRELDTNGGTASWNLLDYKNEKVASGVYIVLSSSADGVDTFVGKIAVIN